MLTVSPVYVLHAFLRNISEKYLKCLLTNKKKEDNEEEDEDEEEEEEQRRP